MFAYLDIEVIKARTNIAGFNAYAENKMAKKAREIKAPSNYKDPEKIAAYIEGKREELAGERDKLWDKTSFDGGFGEVVCICWAVDDGPVQEAVRPSVEDSEAECIATFFAGILAAQEAAHGRPIHWVGSNVLSYDLRVLWQRCVVLGLRPPINLRQADAPWKGTVIDTIHMWRGRES